MRHRVLFPLALLLATLFPTLAHAELPEILKAAAGYDTDRTLAEVLDDDPSLLRYRDPESGWTPLHYAAMEAHVENVRLLLDRGTDIHIEKEGMTPLHQAVRGRHPDITFEGPDGKPRTVSFEDHRRRRVKVIHLLLARGADIHRADARGHTPLCDAAAEGMPRVLVVLIEAGAVVNPADLEKTGGASFPLYHALQRDQFDNAEVLLDHGAEVRAYTRVVRNDPLLSLAVRSGTPEFVRRMLTAGADPHHPAAISMAASYGRLDVVQLLEGEMLIGERRQKALDHAITNAASARHGEVADFLRAKGASVEAERRGLTFALHGAIWSCQLERAQQQVRLGAPTDPYVLAALGRLEELKRAVAADAGVLQFRGGGRQASLLHAAAACGQVEVVAWLLDRGAQIDDATSSGYTPLHLAAQAGHTDVVTELIEGGADVHARLGSLYDVVGKHTPLELAARRRQDAVVLRLLRAGGRIEHAHDAFGELFLAQDEESRREIATLLATPTDQPRLVPLVEWARSAEDERLLTALREAGARF